jgi:maleate isomerase
VNTVSRYNVAEPRQFPFVALQPEFNAQVAPRIGFLVLATDPSCELDLKAMAPEAASLYVSRVAPSLAGTRCCASTKDLAGLSEMLDEAAELLLPDDKLDVVAYACTSGTAVSGLRVIEAKIRAVRPDIPVTTPLNAAVHGFARYGVRRISALMPYKYDISNIVCKFIAAEGIEISRVGFFGLESDAEMGRLSPERLIEAALEIDTPESDAVFLSCTALRTSSIIDHLEQRLGKMVVTSNQAMLWHALTLSGFREPINGFGRLLATQGAR